MLEKTILSINSSPSMNHVLKNIFRNDAKFLSAQDVFTGFNLLKTIKEVDSIIIDFDEQCTDCLDFILFVTSSKIYKRNLVVLVSAEYPDVMNSINQINTITIITKPFNPQQLAETCLTSLILANDY